MNMKIIHHSNQLGIGGTEKCMQYLLEYLKGSGHECWCMYNRERTAVRGSQREELLRAMLGPERMLAYSSEEEFFSLISAVHPDIFHAHRSGSPGEFPLVPRLKEYAGKIVETNVFGGRDPAEFIDLTLYVNKELSRSGRGLMRRRAVLYPPVKRPAHGRDLRERLGLAPSTFVLGRIGRPDDRIFDPISLKALKIIEDSGARDMIYLVQSPPPAMRRAAAELGLETVLFLDAPVVSDDEVSEFFNTIDVLAHARLDGETFGLNIAEAMIHGKPVVSHLSRAANGHARFVRLCGYLAGTGDHEAYAGYLRKLYGDRALAARLGGAGRRFAEENFLLEKLGPRLEAYYADLWRPVPLLRRLSWLL